MPKYSLLYIARVQYNNRPQATDRNAAHPEMKQANCANRYNTRLERKCQCTSNSVKECIHMINSRRGKVCAEEAQVHVRRISNRFDNKTAATLIRFVGTLLATWMGMERCRQGETVPMANDKEAI